MTYKRPSEPLHLLVWTLEAAQVDENHTHYTHNPKERVLPVAGLDFIEEAIYNYRDTCDVVIHAWSERSFEHTKKHSENKQ